MVLGFVMMMHGVKEREFASQSNVIVLLKGIECGGDSRRMAKSGCVMLLETTELWSQGSLIDSLGRSFQQCSSE